MSTINGKACVANGKNLIIQSDLKTGYLLRNTGDFGGTDWANGDDFRSDNYIATNGATVFTFSSPDYVFKGSGNSALAMYDSDKNYLGWQSITSATQTLSKSNVAYIRFSINFIDEGGTSGKLSDWLSAHRYKLEKGSVATPWTPAPVDKVFSNGVQVYGRNLIVQSDLKTGFLVRDTGDFGGTDWNNGNDFRSYNYIATNGATIFTFSSPDYVFKGSGSHTLTMYDSDKNYLGWQSITSATQVLSRSNVAYIRFSINFTDEGGTQGQLSDWLAHHRYKLEAGIMPTPWTPAPEDVM